VFLVLGRGLDAGLEFLANEQDLAILMVNVLWLDFAPRQSAELFDDPIKYQSAYLVYVDALTLWKRRVFGAVARMLGRCVRGF
jgi:hypothetical protein